MIQFKKSAVRIGIGGPVGAGKTTLTAALVKHLRDKFSVAVITNDIYTQEDAEALMRMQILPKDRVIGVETGGCPHTAIREDASINLAAVSKLQADFPDLDIIFIESGGDNLSATFSPELADITIYVIFMAKSITGWSTPSTNLEGRRPRSMELRFSQPSSFSAKTKPYPYQRLQYQE